MRIYLDPYILWVLHILRYTQLHINPVCLACISYHWIKLCKYFLTGQLTRKRNYSTYTHSRKKELEKAKCYILIKVKGITNCPPAGTR